MITTIPINIKIKNDEFVIRNVTFIDVVAALTAARFLA